MISDALEKAFGPDAHKRVGMLLAYTPDEWDFYRAPLRAAHANGDKKHAANGRAKVKSGK